MKKEWIKSYARQWLDSKPALYAIESEAVPRLLYAVKGNDFMLLRDHWIYHLDLHEEADEWIRKCTVPEMAEEMAEIVYDCKNNKRGDLRFGQRIMKTGSMAIRTASIPRDIIRELRIGG